MSFKDLMNCRLVNRKWCALADDHTLWRRLCATKGWKWKDPTLSVHRFALEAAHTDTDDEGMGDEEEDMEIDPPPFFEDSGVAFTELSDSDASGSGHLYSILPFDLHSPSLSLSASSSSTVRSPLIPHSSYSRLVSSASNSATTYPINAAPDYKRLHLTRALLFRRFLSGSYRLSYLQSRGSPNSHTSTIYCLQLYTYPETGVQVLFTGMLATFTEHLFALNIFQVQGIALSGNGTCLQAKFSE
jgi:hypothetical protein